MGILGQYKSDKDITVFLLQKCLMHEFDAMDIISLYNDVKHDSNSLATGLNSTEDKTKLLSFDVFGTILPNVDTQKVDFYIHKLTENNIRTVNRWIRQLIVKDGSGVAVSWLGESLEFHKFD